MSNLTNPVEVEIKIYYAGTQRIAKVQIDCPLSDLQQRADFAVQVCKVVKDALVASVWVP